MRTSWAKALLAQSRATNETDNNRVVIPATTPVVITAKAGIHLDLAVAAAIPTSFASTSKVKMDPSFRWDDDAEGSGPDGGRKITSAFI
ncbi:MAG TPA: hypothetical protein VM469_02650, partial [Pseudoxanthomonas sp.]|nr:hypothetical protein [Pseudoxanthomonas sp.]